jgi:hypothetical protein
MAQCLDQLIYHLHERGVMDCIPSDAEDDADPSKYQIVGHGTGANIALYYIKECLIND